MWLRLLWLLLLLLLLRWWRSGRKGGGGGLLVVVMLLVVLEMLRMRMRRMLTWRRQRIGRGRVVGRMRVHGSGCTELWLQGETAAGRAQNHVMLHLKRMASHLKDRLSNLEPKRLCRGAEDHSNHCFRFGEDLLHAGLESGETSAEVPLNQRSAHVTLIRSSHQSACCYCTSLLVLYHQELQNSVSKHSIVYCLIDR